VDLVCGIHRKVERVVVVKRKRPTLDVRSFATVTRWVTGVSNKDQIRHSYQLEVLNHLIVKPSHGCAKVVEIQVVDRHNSMAAPRTIAHISGIVVSD
jgi:hypothetical protein